MIMKIKICDKQGNEYDVLVDDADYDELSKYNWKPLINKRKKGYTHGLYAWRRQLKHEKQYPCGPYVLMHRQIMGFPNGMCDHIDGNGLNNQRCNLRLATTSGNSINSKKRKKVYKENEWLPRGISYNESLELPFSARICVNRCRYRLGAFATLEEAKLAYDNAAENLHHEYRRIEPQLTQKE
jgi:hypothetical protein